MERRLKLSTWIACALIPFGLGIGQASAADETAQASAADETVQPLTAISLPAGNTPLTSFDISYVDPVIGLYILADRSNASVDVVDTGTNTVVNQIGKGLFAGTGGGNNDIAGPNGVLIVNHSEVWAGDGNSTIKVFDLAGSSTTPTHVISTAHAGSTEQNRADELCVAEEDHVVLMANDAATPFPFISFVSTTTYSVIKQIVFDGTSAPKATNGIEQCQFDKRTKNFYLNLPEVNGAGNNTSPGAVVVISPETLNITDTFTIPLASCAGPQGMAIGPRPQILLGCNGGAAGFAGPSAVINEHNGSVLATLDNEAGADESWFNGGTGHYFIARGNARPLELLGVIDSRGRKEDASFPTTSPGVSSHSVAADSETNHVFVPIGGNAANTLKTCSSLGGNDANGCILVLKDTVDNDDCVAKGAPVIQVNEQGDPEHMKASCRDRNRDD